MNYRIFFFDNQIYKILFYINVLDIIKKGQNVYFFLEISICTI